MEKARWIWYPGDYEINITSELLFRRDYRGIIEPPFWKVDSIYKNVFFVKEVDFKASQQIEIITKCQISVAATICGTIAPIECGKYILPKGSYELTITAYSETFLPAIYINCNALITDETWQVLVDRYRGKKLFVGYSETMGAGIDPDKFSFELVEMFPVNAVNKKTMTLFDFGVETFGYLKVINPCKDCKVMVYYGESEAEALDIDACEVIDEFDLKKGVDYVHNHSRGFRYVAVKSEYGIENVHVLYEYLPLKRRGNFKCSSDIINKIYDVSYYTLSLNSRETFLDGIKRDRWYWGGDAYQSYLYNYYTFFDKSIVQRTTWALRGKDPVTLHVNHIMDYTFYWFIGLYDYYMHTGDVSFIRSIFPAAKSLMEYCLNQADERCFIKSREEDWVFLDWAELDNSGIVSAEQILFYAAIDSMQKICAVLNEQDLRKQYEDFASKLKGNIFGTFYNADTGVFYHNIKSDGKLSEVTTRYANIFAINYGLLDDAQIEKSVKAVLKNENIQAIVTPYAKFYELVAYCEAGHVEEIRDILYSYWGGMLSHGATTFWELYDPNAENHLEMYGRKYGKSLCHAWGSCPLYLLGKYFLGVSPIEAGYSEFTIKPNLCGLDFIEGSVPTPSGTIDIRVDKDRLKVVNNSCGNGKVFINSQNRAGENGERVFEIKAKMTIEI